MSDSTLSADADQVQQAAREYVLAVSGVLSLLLLVLGAGVTFGLVDGRKPVMITLPFLLSGLLVYMLQLITEYRARLGIRRAIEDHLSDRPIADRLISASVLERVVGTRRSSVLTSGALFSLAVVAVDGMALPAAYGVFWSSPARVSGWWRVCGVGYYLALAFSLVVLVIASIEANQAEDRGLREARRIIDRSA